MKKLLRWFVDLISGSDVSSSRRFIAIQAFYFISYLVIIASSKTNLSENNIKLLLQIEEHLYYIVVIGFGFTSASGIVKMITARFPVQPQQQNPYFYQPTIQQPTIEPTATTEEPNV